jgi:diguanylate cyclase (GGDEF)-like protein
MEKVPENKGKGDPFRSFLRSFFKKPVYASDFIAVIPAIKITFVYFLISVIWIVLSDTVVKALFPNHYNIYIVSIIKGIIFVSVTSGFIFYMISRELKRAANLKSDIVEADYALDQKNVLFSAVLESSPDIMVFSLDRDYRYSAFNKRHKYSMLRSWGQEIDIGISALDIMKDKEKAEVLRKEFDRVLSGEYFSSVDEFSESVDSRSYWQKYFSPVMNDKREVIGLTCFVLNITPLKRAQEQNLFMSYHDVLTGLYNRRYCEDAIRKIDKKENMPISVVIGDVNGLKLVNDAFGHHIGDQLLKKGADAITEACEGKGIACRWGSDEYMLLLPGVTENAAEELVNKIKLFCAQSQVNSIPVDISFGLATKTIWEESILYIIKSAEDRMNRNKIVESKSMRNNIIKTIMHTLHEKNPREESHSKRVGELCKKIGLALRLPEIEVNLLNLAGFLHDIGKIAIDDRLLSKSDDLSADDIAVLRTHPEIGCRIIRSPYDVGEIAEAILYHHERWDGTGYPKGLKETAIPKYARVIAIADSFDAMTSKRSYRELFTPERAAEEIRKGSGTLYDPEIVDAFLQAVLTFEWDLADWEV